MASITKDQAAAKRRDRAFFNIGELGRDRTVDSELGKPRAVAGASRTGTANREHGFGISENISREVM